MRLDSIVASCILAASFISFSLALREIRSSHDQTTKAEFLLHEGRNSYRVKSDGHCAGRISVNFVTEPSPIITIDGSVRVTNQSLVEEVRFSSSLNFNVLGQLFNSYSSIQAADLTAALSTDEISPITAKLRLHSPERDFNHTSSIPGPLLLVQHGEKVSVELGSLQSGQEYLHNAIVERARALLAVEIVAEERADCGAAEGALDLSAVGNGLRF